MAHDRVPAGAINVNMNLTLDNVLEPQAVLREEARDMT